jgi:proteasome assembly chaperone 3
MGLSQDYGMDDVLSEMSLPYPAQTKQVAGEINGIVTNVTSISFSDRIMVTITQAGRLAQWVSKHPSL